MNICRRLANRIVEQHSAGKSAKDQIQELTKQFEAKINDLAKAKETEVMEQ